MYGCICYLFDFLSDLHVPCPANIYCYLEGILLISILQAELTSADFELSLNKLKTEKDALRDSLAKMSALSEGLAQDKVELNRILLRVS